MSKVIVALNTSRRMGDCIAYAKFIAQRLATEPVFASPTLPLAAFQADIAALEEAEVRVLTRTMGTVAARNAKLLAVQSDLNTLRSYVQRIADAHPGAAAAAIVESAGMSVKRSSGHGKPDFEVKRGPVSGSVHLFARAARTRASYDWAYGADESLWTRIDSTVRADAEVSGLAPGTRYFFRVRSVTKEGVGNWSQVLSLIVG
jgi:hypothetical protein